MPKPTKPKLTPKQVKIVKAKVESTVKDIPQREWAPAFYPDAKPGSAEVLVSRELNKVHVQEALQIALRNKGITAESIVDVVGDAMSAEKVFVVGQGEAAEVERTPDHSIRLKAAGMAAQFMGLNKQNDSAAPSVHFHHHLESQKDKYGL